MTKIDLVQNVAQADFWLHLARRLLWVLFIGANLATFVGSILFPAYAHLHPELYVPNIAWTVEATQRSLSALGWSPNVLIGYLLFVYWTSALVDIALVFLLLTRKTINWFVLFAVLVLLLGGQNNKLFLPLTPLIPGIEIWSNFVNSITWQFLLILFYVFPDGQFSPRWIVWTIPFWILTNLLGMFGYGWQNPLFLGLMIVLALSTIASQAYRYNRKSNEVQKKQTKIVVFAFAFVLFVSLAVNIPYLTFWHPVDGSAQAFLITLLITAIDTIAWTFIPLSIGIAILKFRLWDIDLIIRKTLIYSALSLTIAGIYLGGVVLLQRIFQELTGISQSPIAIVISTLLIAAIFTRLRQRIQNNIDRRFFRRKYDAQKMLNNFAISARGVVELEQLTQNVLDIVGETLQPATASIWLSNQPVLKEEGRS